MRKARSGETTLAKTDVSLNYCASEDRESISPSGTDYAWWGTVGTRLKVQTYKGLKRTEYGMQWRINIVYVLEQWN